jgi:hypothetical protein
MNDHPAATYWSMRVDAWIVAMILPEVLRFAARNTPRNRQTGFADADANNTHLFRLVKF